MKICSKCKITKTKDEFYKDGRAKSGVTSRCKVCMRKYDKEHYQIPENMEIKRSRNKRYYQTPEGKKITKNRQDTYRKTLIGKEVKRKSHLKRTFNITIENYNKMLDDQDGCCAICGTNNLGGNSFHVDHCHNTGKIRGLLCNKCNPALGLFDSSPNILLRAIKYLNKENK